MRDPLSPGIAGTPQAPGRGVRGLVTTGGVRDVAELHAMNFPVFCAAVSAQGTVKATPGAVNTPVSIGGQHIEPGDAILADDDGVVPQLAVPRTLAAAQERTAKESESRDAFGRGELGLDRYGLRAVRSGLGVEYADYGEYQEPGQ